MAAFSARLGRRSGRRFSWRGRSDETGTPTSIPLLPAQGLWMLSFYRKINVASPRRRAGVCDVGVLTRPRRCVATPRRGRVGCSGRRSRSRRASGSSGKTPRPSCDVCVSRRISTPLKRTAAASVHRLARLPRRASSTVVRAARQKRCPVSSARRLLLYGLHVEQLLERGEVLGVGCVQREAGRERGRRDH